MQISAIHLARATALVEAMDLNPRGTVPYPLIVEQLIQRYGFQVFPHKPEEFDETKGVKFASGFWDGIVIEQLVIYTYGILIDTRKDTVESRRLLQEALTWASTEFGLHYRPQMIKRWNYASSLVFETSANMTALHPALEAACETLTEGVQEYTSEHLPFEITAIVADFDQLKRKHSLGKFSIQRRENTPFSENRYYSEAPIPTKQHIQLLEAFESALLGESKPAAPDLTEPPEQSLVQERPRRAIAFKKDDV